MPEMWCHFRMGINKLLVKIIKFFINKKLINGVINEMVKENLNVKTKENKKIDFISMINKGFEILDTITTKGMKILENLSKMSSMAKAVLNGFGVVFERTEDEEELLQQLKRTKVK